MDEHAHHYVGVEIGATKLQAIRGTAEGRVLDALRVPAAVEGGAAAIQAQVTEMVCRLCDTYDDVAAVGIGFGGPVDEASGRVVMSHQVEGWHNAPLAADLEAACGRPCRLCNDTDCATLAEARVGAGAGHDPAFYTNIGSGIGGGLYANGKLYTGPFGAMEIGHTWAYSRLLARSDRVEDLCSGWAIQRRAAELVESGRWTVMPDPGDGAVGPPDAAAVARAWLAGDPLATRLMEDVLDTFATALCNVISLVNPRVVIIGGGVALLGPPLLERLRASVQSQLLFKAFADNFSILPAQLGEDAVPVGALLLAATEAAIS